MAILPLLSLGIKMSGLDKFFMSYFSGSLSLGIKEMVELGELKKITNTRYSNNEYYLTKSEAKRLTVLLKKISKQDVDLTNYVFIGTKQEYNNLYNETSINPILNEIQTIESTNTKNSNLMGILIIPLIYFIIK